MSREGARLELTEALGLVPPGEALAQAWRGLRGDPFTPPHRWGLSTLRALRGRKSLEAWLGRRRPDRLVPMFNLFNHVPPPPGHGHSVRSTFARDFRGLRQTYDGHIGTDFIVPIGTTVVAAAPGRALRVDREFDRGGLHVLIDHGEGLITDHAHLARALVSPGDDVARGQPIALSGAAGMDLLLGFPWNPPHLHYNVWLDGEPTDPFPREGSGEASLWRGGLEPRPHQGEEDRAFTPTAFDEAAVAAAVAACLDPALRRALERREPLAQRAAEVLFHRIYRPTRFGASPSLYPERHERRPRLDLPFRAQDFVGVAW